LLISLNLLIKPFWLFGIDRTVQNIVGAEVYGLFFALFNFTVLFNILLDLGITNFNVANISKNHKLLDDYFPKITTIKFILGIIYLILSLSIGYFIGYHKKEFLLLIILSLNQFLLSFVLYLRSNISGLQLFKTDSILSTLDRLIVIIICSILLWGKVTNIPFKIEWLVYSQSISYILTALTAFLILQSKSGLLKLKPEFIFIKSIVKQSYPYALLVLFMSVTARIDTVLLERLLPDGNIQAGIYAQVFRLLDALSQFGFLIAGLLLPMFAKMLKEKNAVNQLLDFSFSLLLIPSTILVIMIISYKSDIILLLYNSHINKSLELLPYLILSFLPIASTYIFGTLLTANGNLKELNIIAFSAMLISIILNLIFIPLFKATGSAISAIITQGSIFLAQFIIAKKIFNLKIFYKKILKYFLFVLIICLLGYFHTSIQTTWILSFIILGFIGLVLAILLKLINIKLIYNLILNLEKE
jgi:O-antigen/teichoic acid export membrane protein